MRLGPRNAVGSARVDFFRSPAADLLSSLCMFRTAPQTALKSGDLSMRFGKTLVVVPESAGADTNALRQRMKPWPKLLVLPGRRAAAELPPPVGRYDAEKRS